MSGQGLETIWNSNREFFTGKSIQQVLSMCGDGELRENNTTSSELRRFLALVPSPMLISFAGNCLEKSFNNCGFVLQDIVNEIGTRLGFLVESGRYRGTSGAVGFDGIWRAKDDHQMLIEVKTTDAYRVNLGVIAGYRRQLIEDGKLLAGGSSILLVVGRQDTGDLEAQIRGSRHAWDTRLISIDALSRLMSIKESLETPGVTAKIVEVLKPREYTRVDPIIDLIFDTSREIEGEPTDHERDTPASALTDVDSTTDVAQLRASAADIAGHHLQCTLIQQSRSIFGSSDRELFVACFASKRYVRGGGFWYWFTVRQSHLEYLREAKKSYFCFACGSTDRIVLVPSDLFVGFLKDMRSKENDRWQVEIDWKNSKVLLNQPRQDLTQYVLAKRTPSS